MPEAVKPPSDRIKKQYGYGLRPRGTAFSVYGRRKIVRAGALIGTNTYKTPVLFLTGTLPGSTDEALGAISDYSSWAVNELLTRIPRLWGGKQSDARTIWVWEHQKRGALHWHAIVECPNYLASLRVMKGFKSLWISVVEGIGRKANVDMAQKKDGTTWAGAYEVWQCTAEKAKKRCDRYLAKYVSKGNNFTNEAGYFPTRWYGVSRRLHTELKESICYFPAGSREKSGAWELTEECLQQLIDLGKMSYKQVSFVDKVGAGSTFVFYLSDLAMRVDFRKFLGNIKMKFANSENRKMSAKKTSIHHLIEVGRRPHLLERFLSDLGSYYRGIHSDWVQGLEVPDSELFWLNRYAFDILYRAGLVQSSQCPVERSVGLTGQDVATLEKTVPPEWQWEQSSLLP